MQPSKHIQQALASGTLLHPVSDLPSFCDLTHALALRTGAALTGASPKCAAVADFIGEAEHIVFVVVDGMGWAQLDRLPSGEFLRSQRVMELRAVFPSTTTCAMSTLATGLWPAEHGVPGWWAYLEERKLSVIPLPFQERYTETPLDSLGVSVEEIWPFPPWMKTLSRDSLSIVPHWFPESIFSRYARGYTPGVGYRSISEAVDVVVRRVGSLAKPGYTYLYLPEFDMECHHHGVESVEAARSLAVINDALELLAGELRGRARLVISADHGHADVPTANRVTILDGDPLLELLKVPPTCEPRVPVFHVREGSFTAFEDMFQQRFTDGFVLLPTAQVEALQLLGPVPLSPLAKCRFGDYMGIATKPVTLKYKSPRQLAKPEHIGHHAGLSPDEMRIPLIVV
jgi:hypothetical protein